MSTTHVQVRTESLKYRSELRAGKHLFYADEPLADGGADSAPNPYELLLSALGSCTAITCKMYADRKEWPLTAITVLLNMEIERKPGGQITRIDRTLVFDGELDQNQKHRLLTIANKCPVHKILSNTIAIETVFQPE